MYAIAFDLGTTTLAASLFERTTGRRLAMVGSLNPQREYGADVVSRLDAAVHDPSAAAAMTTLICNELARLGQAVLQQSGVGMQTVRLAALAGNPAMQHLLLGWPVESLARPPFRPRQTAGLTIAAAELDWTFCEQVYLFPQPGGFVGGDTVAFLFGCAAAQPVAPALYLDMGTNGEMVLDDGVTLWATSAAAGPAFEGGNLACGMAALSGAICGVTLDGDRLRIETIGNSRPRGVCGSAVIQLVAALRRDGIMTGRAVCLPLPRWSPIWQPESLTRVRGWPLYCIVTPRGRSLYPRTISVSYSLPRERCGPAWRCCWNGRVYVVTPCRI